MQPAGGACILGPCDCVCDEAAPTPAPNPLWPQCDGFFESQVLNQCLRAGLPQVSPRVPSPSVGS